MKRIIMTLLAALAAAAAAHAQTDTLATFGTKGDLFEISITGFDISPDDDMEEIYTAEYFSQESGREKVTTNFLGFGFGGMVLTTSPYYGPWEGSDDFLDIYPARSSRIDLEVVSLTVPLDKRGRTYYRIGTMFSYDRYRFKDNITLVNNDEGILMPEEIDGQVKKTKLMANYWGINMGFGVKVSKAMIMIQGTAELLTRSAVKYKNPSKNTYQIDGLNSFRSRVTFSTTWNGHGFFIDYTLTPLFKAGVGNDTHAFAVGCRLGF